MLATRRQAQVARLELGEYNQTIATLLVLTSKLKLRFVPAMVPPATPYPCARAKQSSSSTWKTIRAP